MVLYQQVTIVVVDMDLLWDIDHLHTQEHIDLRLAEYIDHLTIILDMADLYLHLLRTDLIVLT
jgi:hypothetical protein